MSARSAEADRYNGWANYESWAVALWLDNDETSYARAQEIAAEARETERETEDAPEPWRRRKAVGVLADALKAWVEEDAPDTGASLWSDLLTHALGRVDWYEVAEHYLAE